MSKKKQNETLDDEKINQEQTDEVIVDNDQDEKEDAQEKVIEVSDKDKIAELEKRYLSLYAEYDNFRKRTAKEKEQLYADAVADVSGAWLQVVDNIDRAVESSAGINETNYEQIAVGIEGIAKGARDIISKLNISEIPAERGSEFDPNYHSAVMHIDDDSLGEQQIAQVFQKGYIYKDRVIRPATVQVAN